MQKKIWKYRDENINKDDIDAFSKEFGVPYPMASLLYIRGICDGEKLSSYVKKTLDGVHNPFLFNDMEIACDRILNAVSQKEKITVYGDYDVDGITATTVLTDFLEEIGADVDYYIPSRFKEGYGLNALAVNKIAKGGTKLLITVDCGIASIGEVELARTLKMDVIITDHHSCHEEIPKAVAVINPKRVDSSYPFSGLAGVGVAFKLILALAKKLGKNTKDTFFKYVDLVTIGTIADVVPLTDENRIIVSRGIENIKNTNNNGIKALVEVSGALEREKNSALVAFSLAPRINAAGRMEDACISVRLFKEKNYDKAKEIAEYLDSLNKKRQQIEQDIYKEALEETQKMPKEQLVYVINREGWHGGVIGIVASRLCERFYRPCILLSEENGKCKGSGRSIEGLNLFDALCDSDELLSAYGGHALAAGLGIKADNLEEFRNKINGFAKKFLTEDKLLPSLDVDMKLDASYLTVKTAETLRFMEPFGSDNEVPVFALENAEINSVSKIGADGKHLHMLLKKDGKIFNAVGFGFGELFNELSIGERVNIAFTLNINVYQGKENLQLMIKDIQK